MRHCRETLHDLGRRNILIIRDQPPHRFPWLATGFDSFFRASLEFQFLPQGNPVKNAQSSITLPQSASSLHTTASKLWVDLGFRRRIDSTHVASALHHIVTRAC